MYRKSVLSADVALIDWSAEKRRGLRPQVDYKAGEEINVRTDPAGTAGTVVTVFHVGLGEKVYSNSRLVRSDGSVMKLFMAPEIHARIVRDMCYVI